MLKRLNSIPTEKLILFLIYFNISALLVLVGYTVGSNIHPTGPTYNVANGGQLIVEPK